MDDDNDKLHTYKSRSSNNFQHYYYEEIENLSRTQPNNHVSNHNYGYHSYEDYNEDYNDDGHVKEVGSPPSWIEYSYQQDVFDSKDEHEAEDEHEEEEESVDSHHHSQRHGRRSHRPHTIHQQHHHYHSSSASYSNSLYNEQGSSTCSGRALNIMMRTSGHLPPPPVAAAPSGGTSRTKNRRGVNYKLSASASSRFSQNTDASPNPQEDCDNGVGDAFVPKYLSSNAMFDEPQIREGQDCDDEEEEEEEEEDGAVSSLGSEPSTSSQDNVIYDGDIAAGVHNDAVLDKALKRRSKSISKKMSSSNGGGGGCKSLDRSRNGGWKDMEMAVEEVGKEMEIIEKKAECRGSFVDVPTPPTSESTSTPVKLPNGLPLEVVLEDGKKDAGMNDVSSLGRSGRRRSRRASRRSDAALRVLQQYESDNEDNDAELLEGSKLDGELDSSSKTERSISVEGPRGVQNRRRSSAKEKHLCKLKHHKKSYVIDRDTKVKFGNVDIRIYERVLGDNPCSAGPPVSIGWRYNIKNSMSLSDFEKKRLKTRKNSQDLVLSRERREAILMHVGYSRAELAERIRKNVKVKNQRRQTVNNLSVAKAEEVAEIVKRKFLHIVRPGFKKCPK